jgi:hypothetical protein
MQRFAGAVSDDLVRRFTGWEHVPSSTTVGDDRCHPVGIEPRLAAAHLWWPDVVEVDGAVCCASRYSPALAHALTPRFGSDQHRVERWMPARERSAVCVTLVDRDITGPGWEDLATALGTVLSLFWSLRLRAGFPQRRCMITTREGIAAASGWALTCAEAS